MSQKALVSLTIVIKLVKLFLMCVLFFRVLPVSPLSADIPVVHWHYHMAVLKKQVRANSDTPGPWLCMLVINSCVVKYFNH